MQRHFGECADYECTNPLFQGQWSQRFAAMADGRCQNALIDGDPVLRTSSSEAVGRIASFAGTPYLTSQTKLLVDQVVNDRDPYGRAGCALALAGIIAFVCHMTLRPGPNGILPSQHTHLLVPPLL